MRLHRIQRRQRRIAAQAAHRAAPPPFDPPGQPRRIGKAQRAQPILKAGLIGLLVRRARTGAAALLDQPVITLGDLFGQLRQLGHQRRAIGQPIQPGHLIERLRAGGQAVRLLVANHLQPVFQRPQPIIGRAQRCGILRRDQPGVGQRIEAGAGAAQAQRRDPPAVDQLMGLGVEFHLADPSAPTLEVEAGARHRDRAVVRANALGQPADLGNRPEVEALAPDERPDRGQKPLALCNVASGSTGPDESRPLPRQRGAFVVAERPVERDRQRADLTGRAQPQIDPEDIAMLAAARQQLHHPPRDTVGSLAGVVALAPGKALRVVDQDRIDIGGIVQLARAVLAQREGEKTVGRGPLDPLGNRGADRGIQRAVGQRGQFVRHPRQRKGPRKVANRQHQRQRIALAPQRYLDRQAGPGGPRHVERRLAFAHAQPVNQRGPARHRPRQKGGKSLGAGEGIGP